MDHYIRNIYGSQSTQAKKVSNSSKKMFVKDRETKRLASLLSSKDVTSITQKMKNLFLEISGGRLEFYRSVNTCRKQQDPVSDSRAQKLRARILEMPRPVSSFRSTTF
jgi:hypothetical protein